MNQADLDKAISYNQRQDGDLWDWDGLPEPVNLGLASADYKVVSSTSYLFQDTFDLGKDGMLGPKTLDKMEEVYFPPPKDVPWVEGKGLWVWIARQMCGTAKGCNLCQSGMGQPLQEALDKAVSAGIQHLLVKVADGRSKNNKNCYAAVAAACEQYDIEFVPWVFSWCYQDDASLQQEIDLHSGIITELGSGKFVNNAEKGFQKYRRNDEDKLVEYPNFRRHATMYNEGLKQDHPDLIIGLSSYCFANVKGNRNFAWQELCDGSNVLMPQSYWSVKGYHSAADCVAKSIETWSQFANGQPTIPSGGCYQVKKDGKWRVDYHTPDQILAFIQDLKGRGISAATFWAWLQSTGYSARVTEDQWLAIVGANI